MKTKNLIFGAKEMIQYLTINEIDIYGVLCNWCLIDCLPASRMISELEIKDIEHTIGKMEMISQVHPQTDSVFETAVSKMDSTGIANLYTTDAKWMNPNAPAVEGRTALVGTIGSALRGGIGSAKLNTVGVWGDENFVTEEGNYLLNAKDGTQIDKGKYLVLWKRVDGKLMFFRDMYNSDLPPAAAAK